MKVESIKIQNFKSFAEENNIIKLDSVNTIIGKNESGKSNLIQAIGELNLTGIKNKDYFKNNNKNNIENKPNISVVLTPYESEKNIYKTEKETTITFNDLNDINIEGGLSEIIKNNIMFRMNKGIVNNLKDKIYFNDINTMRQFNEIVELINNAEKRLFIYPEYNGIISKLEANKSFEEFTIALKVCINYLEKLYSIFPKFILLDDIELKTKYTRRYLEDKAESKQMLNYLLKIIGIDFEKLLDYWKYTREDDKYNFEQEINEKLEVIANDFNDFYKQEKVNFKVKFDNEALNFLIKTNKKFLDLSERSNGLKWYLNMYIQLIAKTQKQNIENYVVLLDEPGVYLHVNAQKEILKLFENFTSKDNQIIYTTQLPTMIYQKKLYRTRIIIKDDFGNSNIGNKYYSLPHKMGSKKETITPILIAIGMNMGYSINSMDDEKINIITEGISDYNYLKALFTQCKYENEYNIIPSAGADNIHNIVSILMGWGYECKIILDQDKEGRKEYNVLVDKLKIEKENIKFVDGSNNENVNIIFTIEDMFSEIDKGNIGVNNDDYAEEKAYYSLELLKKVENGEYEFDEETIVNFNKLIKG